jgi:hypothetical protein
MRAIGCARLTRPLGLLCGYLLVSVWLWRHLVPHFSTHASQYGLYDSGLFIWWLKWTPWAVLHGHDPLHSTYLNAPGGVSALWNTSVVALGVLFAPVTVLFGSVLSFNLACVLGPPLSAWTASMWLGRHARPVSAALGGLIFGFSPFVIGQSANHLMFTWLALLPIIIMLVEDLLWRTPKPIWPQAPLLGLVIAIQLLISSEALLITAMGCVGLAALLAATNLRAAQRRIPVLAPAAGVAVAVALVLCAWPLIEAFGGSNAIRGPVQPLGLYGGRLPMLIQAPPTLFFHTGHGPTGHLSGAENGLYIGWPLLLLLAAATLFLRRKPGIVIGALAVIASVAFQMYGARWHFAGQSISAPLRLLQNHLPVIGSVIPGRFAIVMWLAIAWLVAVAIDEARTRLANRWQMLPVIVAAVCVVPLLPASPSAIGHVPVVPIFFKTSLRDSIPKGAIVMVAPMATVGDDAAEFWQETADMRFRQLGGYALHPIGPRQTATYYPAAKNLTKLFSIGLQSDRAYAGPVTPAMLDAARTELHRAHATMFIVGPAPYHDPRPLRLARQLLSRPPDRTEGGVTIWKMTADTHRLR